jgi:phosphatidylglycerophosphate synthase
VSESVHSAVVVGSGPQAAVPIAGVPIAVRAILALHEAGFRDVALLAPGRPRWAAEPLAQRGVPVRWLEGLPGEARSASGATDGLTLLLAGDVLVDATAVRMLRGAGPGPVWTAAGRRVGLVCRAADTPACSESIDLGAGWPAQGSTPLEPMLGGTRIAAGLAVPLEARGSTRRLEGALLEHIGDRTTSDSYLATLIDRPLSRPLTRLLLRTPVAPSHVTLLSVALGLLGAAGLATVSYWGRLAGVMILLGSIVLDCVDGDLARARLAQSAAGARLDVMGDYVVHLAVFLGVAIGLWRGGLPASGLWAALALMAGVVAAMTVVHALLIRPALRHGGDLHWAGDADSLRGRSGASIAEKLASRDYTYLLLVLAAIGHLEWFLYAAAGGAWVFTAALMAYWLLAVRRRPRAAVPP